LHRRRDEIAAIAARHDVSDMRLFGSVARGEERPDSDIDLLVDIAEDSALPITSRRSMNSREPSAGASNW
jgi:uncharacterized protein